MNLLHRAVPITRLLASTILLAFVAIFFTACDPEEPEPVSPTITGFSPISGTMGSTITITGTNFGPLVADNVVQINGKAATVTSASATSLTITVPEEATSGKITLTTQNKTISSTNDFNVLTMYMAGYDGNTAKYWKNGVATNLTDGVSPSHTNALFIAGNDVYVAGSANGKGTYWKNGTPVTVGASTLYSIYVSGSDVYATSADVYWKNGIAIELTDGKYYSEARSIYVAGNDIHIVGREHNGSKYIAKYWKNGVATPLSDGTTHANALALAVSGADVHIVGYDGAKAKYWKNGVATSLTDGTTSSSANAIFVSGTDVYISGNDGKTANYWKNSIATSLTDGTASRASANTIFVADNVVYAAGYEYGTSIDFAKRWVNGQATTLSDGTGEGRINAILVK